LNQAALKLEDDLWTAIKHELSSYVDHFVERGAIPSSDHISLEFIIKLDPGPPKEVWAFTKTNWPNFVKELESINAKHFESFDAKSTIYDELKLNPKFY
jgi:hypothetical protein